jgi:hypothetical protein
MKFNTALSHSVNPKKKQSCLNKIIHSHSNFIFKRAKKTGFVFYFCSCKNAKISSHLFLRLNHINYQLFVALSGDTSHFDFKEILNNVKLLKLQQQTEN